eukprot:2105268-Amphidinium_carterae.1
MGFLRCLSQTFAAHTLPLMRLRFRSPCAANYLVVVDSEAQLKLLASSLEKIQVTERMSELETCMLDLQSQVLAVEAKKFAVQLRAEVGERAGHKDAFHGSIFKHERVTWCCQQVSVNKSIVCFPFLSGLGRDVVTCRAASPWPIADGTLVASSTRPRQTFPRELI